MFAPMLRPPPQFSQDEDRNEPGKYDDAFRSLKAEIFKSTGVQLLTGHRESHQKTDCFVSYSLSDWASMDPMVYLSPFLMLIKASDVSGPVTGAAAQAMQTILSNDMISACTSHIIV
jgi:hypothetical protein